MNNKKLTFSYFSKYNGEVRFSLDTNNMYYLKNKIIDIDFGENIKVYVENMVHFAISDKLEFKK